MTLAVELHQKRRLLVPQAPVLVPTARGFACLTTDGELTQITVDAARLLLRQHMPIVCHAPRIARRLGMERFFAYDVLELFAFIHPGRFAVPTPQGLARALNLLEPETGEDQCLSLRDCIRHLLADLSAHTDDRTAAPIAAMMSATTSANDTVTDGQANWPWYPAILAACGREETPPGQSEIRTAVRIWDKLPEWAVHAPEPPPGHHGVDVAETAERLRKILSRHNKENRPQQQDYAAALIPAFAPRDHEESARIVIAEAGTGTGKTFGYLAPATLWAEKNGGPVWVSTYTRNLQRQIDAALDHLYDDPVTKARKVVTRKGRENYLCLLNLEDAVQAQNTLMTNTPAAVALGLMLRWAAITADGDLAGVDFPGWLSDLLGRGRLARFADRRGECIYSACPHFNTCFVEKSVRKAKRADIVIANHALVMHQAALDDPNGGLPARFVFDEGHHLFDAADSAFCAHLDGRETAELRRWLLGTETQRKTRARGLKRRLEDLIAGDDGAEKDIEALIDAARALPGPLWRQRLADGAPKGATEQFLLTCRQQVYARARDKDSPYSLEAETHPPVPELFETALALSTRLNDIQKPMLSLIGRLKKRLETEAEDLDSATRERLHYMAASLKRRASFVIGPWIDMLKSLREGAQDNGHVDWLEVTRIEGRDLDVGFYRYALDPAKLFAAQMKPHLHGAVVTSATLRDICTEDPEGWHSAQKRSGLAQIFPPDTFHVASPFDYPAQTRIFVVTDVSKKNAAEVSGAFRALFSAAGGGALGIFTSISRLRAVHARLEQPLADAGLALYAQHADILDTGTLIDIFRAEENACLLGTDATRDGIDVPGRSLRLVVYDRVPWPRPTILHKARRADFAAHKNTADFAAENKIAGATAKGGNLATLKSRDYDDMLTRFKLKQAYGRLIRQQDDKGVFVMLDSAMPSRLATAFPAGVTVTRLSLKETILEIKKFLTEKGRDGD